MNSISFGKMTPQARETATSQTAGIRAVFNVFGGDTTVLENQKQAVERAMYDKNYLIDKNAVNASKSKSSLELLPGLDKDVFVLYRSTSEDDKYSYLGKFDVLPDAVNLADKIDDEIALQKKWGESSENFAWRVATYICDADESRNFEEAKEEGRKIFDAIA